MGLFKRNRAAQDAKTQAILREQQKREQEANETKEKAYQFARVWFDVLLLNIGVKEEPALQVSQDGILPRRSLGVVVEAEKEKNMRVLKRLMKDMQTMTGMTVDEVLEQYAPDFSEPEPSEDTGDKPKEPQQQAVPGEEQQTQVPIEGGKTPSGIIAA